MTPAPARAAGQGIDTSSAQAVADAYINTLVPALDTPVKWNGDIASCDPGTPDPATNASTLAAVNFYREMAGLDPVFEDRALSAKAMRAALMMAANEATNHAPPSTWKCYTQDGADAAAESDLTFSSWAGHGAAAGAEAVALYMNDSDAGNAGQLGHRRWVLTPFDTTIGLASTTRSNAIWLSSGAGTSNSAANPTFTQWPSAGYFPYEMTTPPTDYVPLTAWSVESTSASFGAAHVSVTKNGVPLAVDSVTASSQKYGGTNTLIWQVPPVSQPAAGTEDDYEVSITGITGGPATYAYTVKIFQAYAPPIVDSPSANTSEYCQPGVHTRLQTGFAETVSSNFTLCSASLQDKAVYQSDGNFVLYRDGAPLWSTGTHARGNYLKVQGDGNMVVYDAASRPLWASNTRIHGSTGGYLIVQNDGNMVLYDNVTGAPVWASGTRN